jgi:tungstate transport system permease protein
MLLSRNGLLDDLCRLFTQKAMVVGQIILCLPLFVSISHATIREADQRVWETALTLGARRWR